jgi:hypothetical protein
LLDCQWNRTQINFGQPPLSCPPSSSTGTRHRPFLECTLQIAGLHNRRCRGAGPCGEQRTEDNLRIVDRKVGESPTREIFRRGVKKILIHQHQLVNLLFFLKDCQEMQKTLAASHRDCTTIHCTTKYPFTLSTACKAVLSRIPSLHLLHNISKKNAVDPSSPRPKSSEGWVYLGSHPHLRQRTLFLARNRHV